MRDGGILSPSLLGCRLGIGPQGGDPAHCCHQNLGSWTLPSGFPFPCPHPAQLTPASAPMCRDRLRAGELQDGALQEAPEAVPPGLRLPLLPQQQGPAAEPPQAQIQVLRAQQASRGRRVAAGRSGLRLPALCSRGWGAGRPAPGVAGPQEQWECLGEPNDPLV